MYQCLNSPFRSSFLSVVLLFNNSFSDAVAVKVVNSPVHFRKQIDHMFCGIYVMVLFVLTL